jgi:hypothetical protein
MIGFVFEGGCIAFIIFGMYSLKLLLAERGNSLKNERNEKHETLSR